MRAITVSDAENSRALLQQEINRHQDARYDHRLHCVSLVATGMPCEQVARVFGDSPRSVAGWVRRFDARGLAGLAEGNHSGRPGRLTAEQMEEVRGWLRQSPMPTVVSSTGFAVSPAASRRGKSRSVAPGGA
jgi:transposase-like protein